MWGLWVFPSCRESTAKPARSNPPKGENVGKRICRQPSKLKDAGSNPAVLANPLQNNPNNGLIR